MVIIKDGRKSSGNTLVRLCNCQAGRKRAGASLEFKAALAG